MKQKIQVPAIHTLLHTPEAARLLQEFPRELVTDALRFAVKKEREQQMQQIEKEPATTTALCAAASALLQKDYSASCRKVINATGTILHTNLGRAKLSLAVQEQLYDAAFEFTNVEYDLESGRRGSRYQHLEKLLTKLTGAESALIVNNNAAAVLLLLATFCRQKEVIVSRGELVEIGGSFRIPEIMQLGGAVLREVGTTNKTHLADYEQAFDPEKTSAFLKVHTSNFHIEGFTESVSIQQLRPLADECQVPLFYDMGSGILVNLEKYGIQHEETVQEALAAGADIVTFSGDKLLGGPQAGVIVGKKTFIDALKKNQLTRALRVDKMTIAALEGTLRLYLDEQEISEKLPFYRMLSTPVEALQEKASYLKDELAGLAELHSEVKESIAQIGGGSMPDVKLPTFVVAVRPQAFGVQNLEVALRKLEIPIIVRVQQDELLFDMRTVEKEEILLIAQSIRQILTGKED
ncbi:L-seryl-tRNA(Sec) selenium transferase [Listeria costaricensis]|uniref:L-seryl-tRNA(Sec) selenium transferase n=1 Tax=Listeria costaricensis TaxID=2026604 RepID=UPI000C072979|nr:L-seryl-tRNA(Sec) selenium transferase [Listeria costaricensis]